ncbi:CG5556 [Drosophila busckii]|uniref:CG5556 n=2 Tax=Drosophila busckii TaxID=30019 RepID=A0A0M4EMY9_DROBS|nr:CG5556 [Drosophila busckii]
METAEMAELICRKCKLPVPWEMFLVLVNEHTFHMIANPPLMAGVERLVAHLKYCNIGLGLVSSCKKAQLCQKIQGRDALFNQFDHIICADDPLINQPKPSPDIYLMAMKRFCCNPCADCFLVFEGTTKGVQAAHDAHMEVVMVSESSLPCCWSEQAAARFETLLDFHPEVYGLPPLPANEPEPPDSSTY